MSPILITLSLFFSSALMFSLYHSSAGFLFATLYLGFALVNRRIALYVPALLLSMVWVVVLLLYLAITPYPVQGLDALSWMWVAALAPLCFSLMQAISIEQRVKAFGWAVFAMAGYTVLWALYQELDRGWAFRVMWPLHDHNNLGALAYSLILMLTGLVIDNRQRAYKIGGGLLILALLIVLLLTRSRLSLGFLILGCTIFIGIFLRKENIALKKVLPGLAALVVVLTIGSALSGLADRVKSISLTEKSTQSRIALATTTIKLIADKPQGYGLGAWIPEYAKVRSEKDVESSGVTAHNDYLEIGTNAGIGGLLLLLIPTGFGVLYLTRIVLNPQAATYFQTGALIGFVLLSLHLAGNFIMRQPGLYFFVFTVGLGMLPLPVKTVSRENLVFPVLVAIGVSLMLMVFDYGLLTGSPVFVIG